MALTLLTIAFCLAPTFILYFQGQDLVRTRVMSRLYEFRDLLPGNPLEFLITSTPGMGFEWAYPSPQSARIWKLVSLEENGAYVYCGLLTLPLALLGLISGRRRDKAFLSAILGVSVLVVILSGFSPVFSTILAFRSPLWSVNHYSDITVRLGGFLFLLMASGMGLEALYYRTERSLPLLRKIFFYNTLASLALFAVVRSAHNPFGWLNKPVFGFWVAMVIVYGLFLFQDFKQTTWRMRAVRWFFILALLDCSTVAFLHVRSRWPDVALDFSRQENGVGLKSDLLRYYLDNLLTSKHAVAYFVKKALRDRLPPSGLYCRFRKVPVESQWSLLGGLELLVSEPAAEWPAQLEDCDNDRRPFEIVSASYNRIQLRFDLNGSSLFYWRDNLWPGWKARTNQGAVPLVAAFGSFKSLYLPKESDSLTLTFSPDPFPIFWKISWLLVVIAFLACFISPKALDPSSRGD